MAIQTTELGIVSIVPRGEWNGTTAYQQLNLVSHNGSVYIAILASTNSEPGTGLNWQTYWMPLVSTPVSMGDWSNATTYNTLNIVTNGGNVYIATQASTNIEPGVATGWQNYWDLLIQGYSGSSGTITIQSTQWSSKTVSFTVTGTTGADSEAVTFSPATQQDAAILNDADIFVSTSGSTVTFTARGAVPTSSVTLNYYVSR